VVVVVVAVAVAVELQQHTVSQSFNCDCGCVRINKLSFTCYISRGYKLCAVCYLTKYDIEA